MVYAPGPGNAQTNSEVLFRTLPKVEITKVNLSFADRGQTLGVNDAEAIYDRNPHIDIDRSVDFGSIAGNLPARFRSNIRNQTNSARSDDVLVSIYLTVKLPRENSLIASVIGQDVVRRALRLNVLINQVMKPKLFSEEFLSKNIDDVLSEPGLYSIMLSDLQLETEIVEENQMMDVYTYRLDITQPRIENLSILSFVSLDIQSLLSALNDNAASALGPCRGIREAVVNTNTGTEQNIAGQRTLFLAVEDGALLSNDAYVVGGKVVYEKVYKIQDFRIRKEIESIPLDFSVVENKIYTSLKKDLRNERVSIELNESNFSDIYLSRDIDNNCRFYFTIDWRKIILNNSVFGKIIEQAGPSEINLLLSTTNILSLKVKRRRIEGSSEIGSRPRDKKFDENEIIETVIESKDTDFYSGLQEVVVPSGGMQPSRLIERVDLGTNFENFYSRSIRTFTGVDGSISSKTDGYYKYEIEIEFIDKSIDVIQYYMTKLQYAITIIDLYNKDVNTLPSPFNSTTNTFSREFIERYTDNLGGFKTTGFPSDIKNSIDAAPVPNALFPSAGLVQILKFFSSRDDGVFDEDRIRNALLDFVNPNSATPESVNILLSLMKDLHSKIESIMGVVYTDTYNQYGNRTRIRPAIKRHVSSANRLCKVSKISEKEFDANAYKRLGFDFLGTTEGNFLSQGLMTIPSSHITQCAIEEKNKFFKTDVEDLPDFRFSFWMSNQGVGSLDGTYYTPRKIVLPGIDNDVHSRGAANQSSATNLQPLDYLSIIPWSLLGKGSLGIEYIKNILSSISQALETEAENNEERSVLSNQLATYFANFYNTIVVTDSQNTIAGQASISRNSGGDTYYRGMAALEQIQKAGMYGAFIDFLNTVHSEDMTEEIISKINMMSKSENVRHYYDITLGPTQPGTIRRHLVNLPSDADRVEFVRQSPIQIKALIYSTDVLNSDPINSSFRDIIDITAPSEVYDYGPAFQYTTQMINRLDVLTGYDIDDETGELMLKSPIWEPLINVVRRQAGSFNNFPLPNNAPHLCRISPYVSEKYLIDRDEKYNLPTYDEYFIMEP